MQRLVASFVLALTAVAFADEARTINFTQALADQDGEAILECADTPSPRDDRDCKTRRPVTLGMLALRSLAMPEQGLSPEESLKRGALALSVYKSSGAKLTAEEISLIKKQIAKTYNPVLVGLIFPLLDPATGK